MFLIEMRETEPDPERPFTSPIKFNLTSLISNSEENRPMMIKRNPTDESLYNISGAFQDR